MKFVRLLTEHPELAVELQSLFESHAFVVEVSADEDSFSPMPDIEIDLRQHPRDEALRMARELAKTEFDLFRSPGISEPPVPPQMETRKKMIPGGDDSHSVVAPIRPEANYAEHAFTNPAWQTVPSLAPSSVQKEHMQHVALAVLHSAKQLENESVAVAQKRVTDWLLRLGCVLERKRELLSRQRVVLEKRISASRLSLAQLRHGRRTSQTAWLKVVVAGAAVMFILFSATVWRDYGRPTSSESVETQHHLSSSAAKDTNRGTGVHPDEVTPTEKSRVAADIKPVYSAETAKKRTRPRNSPHQRPAVGDDEVIIHYYSKPQPKPAPVAHEDRQISGIRHITENN